MTLPSPELKPVSAAAMLMTLPTFTDILGALEQKFGFSPRPSQIKLAELTRGAFLGNGILCAEAPTGTGKTMAYLAGALDAMAHSGNPIPIVVATATVGLQEQILRHDIPRLVAAGALDPRTVCVAKGRGRYFCPRTAALLEDKKMRDTQHDMFQTDKHVAEGGTTIALDMLKTWREKKWDGDRDSWPGVIPGCWEASCGASSDTCIGRTCEYFEACPYMQSRQKLAHAKVIIANHDIVLADLAQRSAEQTNTVLPPKRYALVVDEAHRFPDKAIATKKATANLSEVDWLRQMEAYGEATLSVGKVAKALTKNSEFSADIFSVGSAKIAKFMDELSDFVKKTGKFNQMRVWSWGLKTPDDDVRQKVLALIGLVHSLHLGLKAALTAYTNLADEAIGADKAFAIRMLTHTHTYMNKTEDLYKGLELFTLSENLVRWAALTREDGVRLHTQPLEGNDVLGDLMWKQEFPVVLVSATLQVAGSFDRFISKCGLPAHAKTVALDPVFDYSRGFLHQPKMEFEPSDPGYEDEVIKVLGLLFKAGIGSGMLVLFTSRESMRRVSRQLPEHLQALTLVQDHRPVPELVAEHRNRIDAGHRSILIGLDSMAEGLDLPGKYLSHVVIVRLPFAVPGDPVEEARRDLLGSKWFEQAYLADMLTTLIQAAGRLIRRESDHGVITLLDKRLHTKRYALKAYDALPGFTRVTKLSEYKSMAESRKFDMTHGTAPKAKPALVAVSSPAPAPKAVAAATVTAPASMENSPAKATTIPPSNPLDNLWSIAKKLSPATGPIACTVDTFLHVIANISPVITSSSASQIPLMGSDTPCLPAGSPAYAWIERNMPQAVMLGLLIRNAPWDHKKPLWAKVLRLRPDLMQYAQVLRSHVRQELDDRCSMLSSAECLSLIERGLARTGYPGGDLLLTELDCIEAETVVVLNEPHIMPSKELLMEMPQAAQKLKG